MMRSQKIIISLNFMKSIYVAFVIIVSAFQAKAQEPPLILACTGSGTAGNTNMILNFDSFLMGSGVVDGVEIVFTNMLSGGNGSYNLIGWPRSQDTGNTRDIKHKIEISVDRYSGSYSMTVSRLGAGSKATGSSSGRCEKNQGVPKF